VDGAATASAQALIGGAAAGFATSGQSLSAANGAPNAASTSAILKANKAIAAAFGAAPSFFEIGELGGAYAASGGTASQTTTESAEVVVDLTQLAVRQDLELGLFKGTAVGTGVTGVTFDLYADGTDVIHQSFATAAAAVAYFTNHAIDVGSLASGALSGNTLTLNAVMSVTTSKAGSGFYGGILLGDPPALVSARPHPNTNAFVEAMAGLGGQAKGGEFIRVRSSMLSTPFLAYSPAHPLA
jgi:hypothetical protein